MATVAELTAPYGNVMLAPRAGPDVCVSCFNFTRGYERCYACAHTPSYVDAILPVSYSVGSEQLHYALRAYKRLDAEIAQRLRLELAAVLWRFLARHESCLARAAGAPGFELVTTVPSSDPGRDREHPLRSMIAAVVGPTRERHRRLLGTGSQPGAPHEFGEHRFTAVEPLQGQSVLLVDDTWTTGASANSAAATLKRAGAGPVATVVIGRHLNREWHENDRKLRGITQPYDWERCALCARPAS